MRFSLVTAADADPVSLEEAKSHLRVDIDDQDDVINGYLVAARSYLEEICNRSFISSTWDYYVDYEWPWIVDLDNGGCHVQMIEVPKAPLVSVTSITYVGSNGATQTLASSQYVVDGAGTIGRIYPAYDVTWPTVRQQMRAITVRFVAGYGTSPDNVPEPIKQAIKLETEYYFDGDEKNHEAALALIQTFRVHF